MTDDEARELLQLHSLLSELKAKHLPYSGWHGFYDRLLGTTAYDAERAAWQLRVDDDSHKAAWQPFKANLP